MKIPLSILAGLLPFLTAESSLAQLSPIFQDSGEELISTQGNLSRDVALGDVDGNGTVDAIVAQGAGGSPQPNVIWINDGSGLFTESPVLIGSGDSRSVALGDLDGDGDLDAWFGNDEDDEVWLNLGGTQGGISGTFTNSQTVANGSTERVVLGDLDGDTDLDALLLGTTTQVWWNSGGGQFMAGPDLPVDWAYDLALADLDRDGDLDVVAGGEGIWIPNRVIWNDWRDHQQFLQGPDLVMEGIANGVAITNLNNDLFPDIFFATTSSNQVWWNNGDQTFTPGDFLGDENDTAVALADLDGDRDIDAFVVRRGLGGAPNGYWLNNGDRTFTLSPQILGNFTSFAVALEDLNKDGQPDAFVANSGPNKVWLNISPPRGRPGFFVDSGQLLNARMSGVALGDLDGDGDLDAVTSGFGGYFYSMEVMEVSDARMWLNQGGAQNGQAGRFLDSGMRFDTRESKGVALGDLDDDNDLDIFFANTGGNTVWLNQGGAQGGTAGTFADSGQALGRFYSERAALADLDGDDDLDALVANSLARPRLWVNQGGTQSGTAGVFEERILGEELEVPDSTDAAVADLDGDGDLDAVLNDGSTVLIYHNQGGLQGGMEGVFTGMESTNSRVYFLRGFALGDLDGDLDPDLYLAAYFDDTIWFNQEGALIDGFQDLDGLNATKVALGDLDGDGDVDAFLVGDGASQTWTNDGTGVFGADVTLGGTVGLGVALGDLDGDGDLDAFVASPRGGQIWLNGELNRWPVMFYQIDLQPDPAGELVYNWWDRGNAIVPFRLSHAADQEISVQINGRYEVTGHLQLSPLETIRFPPGSTRATATIWPKRPGGREGEIWNVYQGTDEIEQDRVRYTITLSNITAGVTLIGPTEFYLDIRNPDFGTRQCILDGILDLTQTAGGGAARLEWAASTTGLPETDETIPLSTYRALRNQVLALSPQGQYFVDLYRHVSPELLQAVSAQPWLLRQTVSVVEQWAPAFQALAEGSGDEVTVTPEMLAAGMDYLDQLRAVVSPELESILRTELEALDVPSWANLTLNEALTQVKTRKIPASFTRVYLIESAGELRLHWWGELGQSYRVHRSIADLDSFEPVGDWLSGSGGAMYITVSKNEEASVFYRLEIAEGDP